VTLLKEARRLDYDRTLAALRARAPEGLYALIAFKGELEDIRRKTTDPIPFEMRLLWWREALVDIEAGKIRKHPLLEGLNAALKKGALDEGLLDVMIATTFEEFQTPAETFESFLKDRKFHSEAFYMNTLMALDAKEDAADFAAFRAFDAVTLLNRQPFFEGRGQPLFIGAVDWGLLGNLLKEGLAGQSRYFQGLNALAGWHLKRLKSRKKGLPAAFHPGKFFALWRA